MQGLYANFRGRVTRVFASGAAQERLDPGRGPGCVSDTYALVPAGEAVLDAHVGARDAESARQELDQLGIGPSVHGRRPEPDSQPFSVPAGNLAA